MRNYMFGQLGMVALAAVTVGVVGCGSDATRSPVAPTAAAVASTGAVTDSHHGGGDNSGSGNNSNSNPNKEVEVNGTIQAVSGTCPALHLTIAGRSVSTTASTDFKDAACAKLAVGQSAEVKGTLQADGSVSATRIQVDAKDNNEDNGAEVSGAITASTGTCPALTLTVGTTTVKTTAATVFHDAVCTALPVGTMIEAKGTKQADGSLLASSIERDGGN